MSKAVVRNINININGKEVVNSLNGITKGLRETNRDLRNLNKSDADYTEQLKKHQDRIVELKAKQKEFTAEIYSTSKALKDSKKDLDAGAFSYQNFVNALTSGDIQGVKEEYELLRNGISNVTKQLLAFIATPIGAALTLLTGIVVVTKYWYDYNVEMEKATRLMQQFTSLTGEALEMATVRTKAFAEVANEDLKKVANTVNAVAKAYKIDYLSALELVENGYVRGGKAADDFFDNASEYVVHFKNAGYTAKEFFSILEEGAKSGTYKDKLVDTIKEMDIRLKEMTKSASDALTAAFGSGFTTKLANGVKTGTISTKEALILINKEADKVGLNFQQKQQLVADVFGSMGEDAGGFEAVIKAINDGLEKTDRKLTDVEAAQLRVIKATEELDIQISKLFNTTGGGFETLIADTKVWVLNWLAKMVRGFHNLTILAGAFNGTVATIIITIQEASKAFLGFSEVGKKAWDLDFGGAADAFKKHFNNVSNIIKAGKETVKQVLSEAGKEIQSNYYTGTINGWGSDDFGNEDGKGNGGKGGNKVDKKAEEKAKREREKAIEAEKKKHEALKALFDKAEEEIDEILRQSLEQRELLRLKGLEREEAAITNKYANEIKKQQENIAAMKAVDVKKTAEEIAKIQAHTDRLKELEATRDAELEAARAQRSEEYRLQAEELAEENRISKEEQEYERRAEAATTEEERQFILLEKAREISLLEIDIEREKELAKVEAVEGAEELKNQIRQKYAYQEQKVRADFDKAERTLRSNQVDWTRLTEEQKLNSVKGALNSAAEAFNEGSGAWKATKIAETVITTYQSATNAFNSLSGIPIVGPALGAAAAALAVVSGIKNVQKISSTPLQKMPTHYHGGPTGNKGIGMSDEYGQLTGMVHANEWVAPAFMAQSPRYAPIIDWLDNERQMQLNGVSGSVANPFFDNPVFSMLTGTLMQLNGNLENGIVAKSFFGYEELEKMDKLLKELQQTKNNAIISE
ncbi:phage tail tape measure protein [Paenimyroides baculatum]|uniref:Phage tail tape measure protein domain-containing protein n=1 Tax=Paenimyroides baculatum TaxID=2608000 RepID=A0A5M6CFX9_9FLAO|nr:phage tail tape measure protein [Paenimyroides baculatum]KAA5532822.1 hypothetical protein F0460_13340 [Paenimyroides baculatum]